MTDLPIFVKYIIRYILTYLFEIFLKLEKSRKFHVLIFRTYYTNYIV